MKLASWNINNLNRRLPLLLQWLAEASPDVVVLQETKTTDAAFPKDAIEAAGYGAMHVGQPTWNGVAILARDAEPIPIRRALPGDPTDKEARYLEAAVAGIVVAALYAPNGNPCPGPKFERKLAWMKRLQIHAAELWKSGHPVFLAGDFNVVPSDAVADIYSPRSWHDNALLQPAVRTAWQALLAQGWTDALAKMHPTEACYTFWDYRRNRWPRDAGLRIDHLLLSDSLKPRLREAGVDRAMRALPDASDHAPVWLRLV